MGLLWLSLRVRWRRAWLASLGLGLLIGAVAAFVMAASASARRVDGAYDQLLRDIDPPQVMVIPECVVPANGLGCEQTEADTGDLFAKLQGLAVVEKVRSVEAILPFLVDASGEPLLADADDRYGCIDDDRFVSALATNQGGPGDQPMPFRLDGEMPAAGSAEVVIPHATAERVGLARGDSIYLAGWCTDGDPVRMPTIRLEITGLSVGPLDIEPPGSGLAIEPAYVDRSVFEQLVASGAEPQRNTAVWIDPAADPDAVSDQLSDYDIVIDLRARAESFDAVLASDSRLLWLLAGLGAASGLLLLLPLIAANLRAGGRETPALVALGASRKQLTWHGIAHIITVALIATVPAAVLTAPISAVMPRGFAAAIAPRRELWFDPIVTFGGVAVLVIVVFALALWPAWAASSPRRPAVLRQGNADAVVDVRERGFAVGATHLRPSVQSGLQAAIGVPAGPRHASPWPSLISLTVAATMCIASLTYLAGLDRLHHDTSLVGWNWTATVDFQREFADQVASVIENVRRLDGVEQVTRGTAYPPAFLFEPESGTTIWPWSFDTGPGAIGPTIMSGRAPSGADEIAIDDLFAEHTGLGVGDTVTLVRPTLASTLFDDLQNRPDELGEADLRLEQPDEQQVTADFEITGRTVLPLQRTQDIAQAAFTLDGLEAFVEPADGELQAALDWLPSDFPPSLQAEVDDRLTNLEIDDRAAYVRFSGDPRRLAVDVAGVEGIEQVVVPTDEQVLTLFVGLNLSRTDRVPLALLNVLAWAAAILLVALLIVSVRARHREMAIMRTLGLSSSGVRWSIAIHATVTAVVPLVVAVPFGVVIGRSAWADYARDLGVQPAADTPWLAIVLVGIAAVAIANVTALACAPSLANRSLARELRTG